jgi:hypothetical protein
LVHIAAADLRRECVTFGWRKIVEKLTKTVINGLQFRGRGGEDGGSRSKNLNTKPLSSQTGFENFKNQATIHVTIKN